MNTHRDTFTDIEKGNYVATYSLPCQIRLDTCLLFITGLEHMRLTCKFLSPSHKYQLNPSPSLFFLLPPRPLSTNLSSLPISWSSAPISVPCSHFLRDNRSVLIQNFVQGVLSRSPLYSTPLHIPSYLSHANILEVTSFGIMFLNLQTRNLAICHNVPYVFFNIYILLIIFVEIILSALTLFSVACKFQKSSPLLTTDFQNPE